MPVLWWLLSENVIDTGGVSINYLCTLVLRLGSYIKIICTALLLYVSNGASYRVTVILEH